MKKKMLLHMLVAAGIVTLSTSALTAQTPAQKKPTVAVLSINSKGVIDDPSTVAYMAILELEKLNVYEVMDQYDIQDVLSKNNIDSKTCLGKSCLVNAGKLLNAEKMLTGNVDRFGEKIVITVKLIDVKTEAVEKSNTTEYLNLQPELQKMVEISVKRLLDIQPDPNMVSLLVNYDAPISSPKTQLRLNGPRMGASITLGDAGSRLQASKDEGGFDMYPVTFQFGYQQEVQYLSAGNFQALVEFIGLFGGLESGTIIPSLTIANGFRWSLSGWEFGFGPTFRLVKKADGFYDDMGYLGEKGKWHLQNDYKGSLLIDSTLSPLTNPYPIISRLDSRGFVKLSTGLIIAAGKTFKSGYLNIPVNVYVSPRKDGWIYGFSFGFNIFKKPKVQ